ncbi:hypothetical protein [Sutcliffiella cohnii]|uniref:hypothetical protein n=1 Tax=Sutcliffiella cohnii TaxID=33932 RepID=UPI002E240E3C|nr:hypothetical protein [Sutcliffiella cohnii]
MDLKKNDDVNSTNDILDVLQFAFQEGNNQKNISAKELVEKISKRLEKLTRTT